MRASLYNNPYFATGMSSVLDGFLGGDPAKIAQAEMLAARAGLDNQTAQYRTQIGEAGDAGDLGTMLIRSLQAGNDFSAAAPEIASAWASIPGSGYTQAQQDQIQLGTGVQNAGGTMGGLAQTLDAAYERADLPYQWDEKRRRAGQAAYEGAIDEAFVVQGLVDRGLPEHIAKGFALNFIDESGLNPGINEIAPVVPGSRGGFGLAQWTGPRRTSLEKWAGLRGVDPADPNAQLDFLMEELRGPEAAAYRKMMMTQDVSGAATSILTDFLRPAPEHQATRAARYAQAPNVVPLLKAAGNADMSEGQAKTLADLAGVLLEDQLAAPDAVEPITLGRGDRLVNPTDGSVLVDAIPEADADADPADVPALSASGRATVLNALGDDVDPAVGMTVVQQIEALLGPGMSENAAIEYGLNNLERGPDTPDTAWFSDNSGPGPIIGIRPPLQPAADPAASVGQQQQGGIAEPKSEAEYAALPSGTRYKAPDGSIRVKP